MQSKELEFSDNIVGDFFTAKNTGLDIINSINFPINKFIWFKDNYWNFENFNKYKRDPNKYKYDFMNISPGYRPFIKLLLINERLFLKNEWGTVLKYYDLHRTFTRFLLSRGIDDVRLINEKVIKDYVEGLLINKKPAYVGKMTIAIRRFVSLLQNDFSLPFGNTLPYLISVGSKCEKQKPNTTVNEYIYTR
jgi:hypothetical protein